MSLKILTRIEDDCLFNNFLLNEVLQDSGGHFFTQGGGGGGRASLLF